VEHIAQALQSATDRRLAQKKPGGGAGDVSFLCQYGEDDEKVEISLAQLRGTHTQYYFYAWDVSILECNLRAKTTPPETSEKQIPEKDIISNLANTYCLSPRRGLVSST
jgi:hypothetical protein